MNTLLKIAVLAAAMSLLFSTAGITAKAKKPVAKKPATTNKATLGTTQLSGENAQLGTVYTLGKTSPMNITLRSAEYTVEAVRISNQTYTPSAEEKLLVLHLTYHNPQKGEQFVRWDSYPFTIVDPKDKNHDGPQDMGTDEKVSTTFAMSMKPAQKNEVVVVMAVPADGEMPKLIIKGSDELVLRYDLRGKVKGLSAPYADPADKTGATALAKVPATPGVYWPVGKFNFKFNKAEHTSETKMGETALYDGEKFFVVSFTLKNISGSEEYFRWDTIANKVIDVDGVSVAECACDLFPASRASSFQNSIQPGQEMNLRYIYKIPSDASLKTLAVTEGTGRTFEFDLSGVQ